jgi:hypothetical protein
LFASIQGGFNEAAKKLMFCIRARLQSCRNCMKNRWALAPAEVGVRNGTFFPSK